MSLKPLLHQQEAIANLNEQFKQKNNKALVVLPSGSGKTHTIAFHIAQLKPKSFLYVVHRNEINNQTIKIFREICNLGNIDIGIIDKNNKQFDRPYLFATVQTLFRDKNLEKMNKKIEYMVVDEFHHVAAESYDKILKYFKPKYLVGLTATPYRLDELNIMKYIDNNITTNVNLFEGIERDILVPFNYVGLWDNIDYSEIRFSGYKYNVGDLDRQLIIHKRDEAVIEEYKKRILPENRLTIGFCNSVEHVNRITKKFNNNGIKAVAITYKERPEVREEILYNFKRGYYKVLFTRDILNEGVDFPECSAVMLLRPTISKTIFFQQIGRGLRKHPSKKDVLVLDYIGNYYRAFEKRRWLEMFKKQGEGTGKNIKPYYEYSPNIKIQFDQKIIEMMEIQERDFKSWSPASKELIYKDYMNCCEKEGKILNTEGYRKSQYRMFSLNTLLNYFGSFTNFIKEYNIDYKRDFKSPSLFHYCNDKQKLIDNFHKVKKKFNKEGLKNKRDPISNNPSSTYINDVTKSRYGVQSYERVWGNYGNFLNQMNMIKDSEYQINNDVKNRDKEISKRVKLLQKKLGRKYISKTEWRKEYGGLGRYIFDHKGFGAFRRHFNIPEKYTSKCLICGNEFSSFFTTKRYCGRKCELKGWYKENTGIDRIKERNDKLELVDNCKNCDKQYKPYRKLNSSVRRSDFCSSSCRDKYYHKTHRKS